MTDTRSSAKSITDTVHLYKVLNGLKLHTKENKTMKSEPTKKTVKDSLVEALGDYQEENSIGKPDNPTLPLVGSENVPISHTEEELYRV